MNRSVVIEGGRILIDGVPRVLLCSSLFPFRIPREQWRERLDAVKALGYDALDVYVPWNFHEVTPGVFDFEGERDIDHFLGLAAEAGLLVIARPGPYICSEYDGGGLPAWLGTIDGLRLRQDEPLYLAHVRTWFDRIMPILAARQVTHGGTVMMVQLENELDFYPCDDPASYLTALQVMAVRHDFTVPLMACAGQGDIERATGMVEGVVPAVNMYPDDEALDIEAGASYYADWLEARGLPLLVMETNRLHRTLRRLLASGAKLLAPYLQASSWNFDHDGSVNNWGAPLGFMTSDYDFGGAIAPNGAERPDAAEGRILARVIAALGPRLGGARPVAAHHFAPVDGGDPLRFPTRTLSLDGGGVLTSVTNLSDAEAAGALSTPSGPVEIRVPPASCQLLPADLPLDSVGIDGVLLASTAEVIELSRRDAGAVIVVHARGQATLRLLLPGGQPRPTAQPGETVGAPAEGVFEVTLGPGSVRLWDSTGADLEIRLIESIDAGAPLRRAEDGPSVPRVVAEGGWSASVEAVDVTPGFADLCADARQVGFDPGPPRHMEHHGLYRGCAIYTASLPAAEAVGLLLGAAGDIVTAELDGLVLPTVANGGSDLFLDFDGRRPVADGTRAVVRIEAWGHSNFHDVRLPSMRMGSLRGMSSAALVTGIVPLADGWVVDGQAAPGEAQVGQAPAPYQRWGGWASGVRPERLTYRRAIVLPDGTNAAALRITGTQAVHDVFVDGREVGQVTPLAPVLDLTSVLGGRSRLALAITTTRPFDEQPGTASLLVGRTVGAWTVAGLAVDELARAAERARLDTTIMDLPLRVQPGAPRWLHLDVATQTSAARRFDADVVIRPLGSGLRLTVIHRGRILGRLWTDAPNGAALVGGRGGIALAPWPWLRRDPRVSILIEAFGPGAGSLDGLVIGDGIDPVP